MSRYTEHVRKLKREAEHRFAVVGHDELGDGVLMRDVGRWAPMLLWVTTETCIANTDPKDRTTIGHYDFFYRAYLLLHNAACAERKDHVGFQREIYDYVDKNDAGHAYAVFTGLFMQAFCTLMYTSGAVISGMVEQKPEAFFGHALAQSILNNTPADQLRATAQYLQNEGVYPRTAATAMFNQQLTGISEMILEEQEQIITKLQELREAEAATPEPSAAVEPEVTATVEELPNV
jgi:hypothetical protein